MAGYSEIAPLIQSQLIVAYLVHFINISMPKYALSVACSSGKKMKRALLDNSYHLCHVARSTVFKSTVITAACIVISISLPSNTGKPR